MELTGHAFSQESNSLSLRPQVSGLCLHGPLDDQLFVRFSNWHFVLTDFEPWLCSLAKTAHIQKGKEVLKRRCPDVICGTGKHTGVNEESSVFNWTWGASSFYFYCLAKIFCSIREERIYSTYKSWL